LFNFTPALSFGEGAKNKMQGKVTSFSEGLGEVDS